MVEALIPSKPSRSRIAALAELISEAGLRNGWLSLLAARIEGRPELAYILNDPVFDGVVLTDNNLLQDLGLVQVASLYEFSLALDNRVSRKKNGQYFTPDDIAATLAWLAGSFEDGVWLDPCSGVGNLSWHLLKTQDDPESFLLTRLFLADRDDLALLIARVLFTEEFQNQIPDLFIRLGSRFLVHDFLGSAPPIDFDYVLMNPPYHSHGPLPGFESSGDLYALFMEQAARSSRGFVSITPLSFTHSAKFTALRKVLLRGFDGLTCYTFDNVPDTVFSGVKFGSVNTNVRNSTRAAILVAKEVGTEHRSTPLLRWPKRERERLFENLDSFLTEPSSPSKRPSVDQVPNLSADLAEVDSHNSDGPASIVFTEAGFPKVGRWYEEIYTELSKLPALEGIISPQPTDFMLHIPTTPRYFISALKNPVSRTSIRDLYFASEDHLNRAYLLLNSSLTYFWWRVMGNGMSLTLETLKSIPLPSNSVDLKLVSMLEKSEAVNRVRKLNAGSFQENVKHPKEVVSALNDFWLPAHSERLSALHQGNDLHILDISDNTPIQ